MSARDIFKCGVTYSVGTGTRINWWTDIWLGEAPLCTHFPCIFSDALSKDLRVRDCWGSNRRQWNRILEGIDASTSSINEPIRLLKDAVNDISPNNNPDGIHWRWSTHGTFTVKSAFMFLQDDGLRGRFLPRLWAIRVPLKVKIFLWLVLRGRVRTKVNLSKRGWTGDVTCNFCSEAAESIDHLFLACPNTKAILHCLLPNKRAFALCPSAR